MYIQLTHYKGNEIYDSTVSYHSNEEVKNDLSKLEENQYIEDNGVIYWDDGSITGIFIPINKKIIATYSAHE